MTNNKLVGEDLLELQKRKGRICVSVVVPVHRLSPARQGDKLEVKKAIEKAGQLLHYKYGERKETDALLKSLDVLYQSIDFTHNLDGIGLYVSDDVKLSVPFPFPVKEKIMVGDNFEIRDLLYKLNYASPYYTLLLSEKGAKLFDARWDQLTEIKDNHFPVEYRDDYAYSKPVRSSSYAGHSHVKIFEKDKPEMETIRFTDFFRKVDKMLESYLTGDIPLVIAGAGKELSLFTRVSRHAKNTIEKIKGNHNYGNEKELADMVWPAMRLHLENKWKNLIKEFKEKIGEGFGISGIQDIWSAAKEGKAYKLLVEKDYRCPGFVERDQIQYHLYLRPPQKPHKVLADAVDDLIEIVMEKNGHVYFVENGLLKDYNSIVLITRY